MTSTVTPTGTTIPPDPETIYIGVVTGDGWTNVFASRTELGMFKQVADWCRKYWFRLDFFGFETDETNYETPPTDDIQCVKIYFDPDFNTDGESFEEHSVELNP